MASLVDKLRNEVRSSLRFIIADLKNERFPDEPVQNIRIGDKINFKLRVKNASPVPIRDVIFRFEPTSAIELTGTEYNFSERQRWADHRALSGLSIFRSVPSL